MNELIWIPKIQIRYIDTKHQLADMLTKGNFTCDEWNKLLHLFNISPFSSVYCAQNFSWTSWSKKMAKRMQGQEEDRIVAKSKPMAMNLTSTVSTSSSFVNHPIASKSPGILKGLCRTDWPSSGKPVAREHNQDTALSSQMWQKDAKMDESTRRLAAAEKDQELLNIHLLQGPATLFVVVEGLSTCQDSHLMGKPRAGQGSPLRVAQGGPFGYGREAPPNRAHGRRIIESDCTTLLITGPRCKRLREWTQPLHCVLRNWWISSKTTAPTTLIHRAAGRSCRDRWRA